MDGHERRIFTALPVRITGKRVNRREKPKQVPSVKKNVFEQVTPFVTHIIGHRRM
jgi:hypothetical protein